MSLVSVGPLWRWPGLTAAMVTTPAIATDATLDAVGEYVAYVFQAREDMTISHVGWRTGVVAGAPTADTRIETVAADGTPSGTLWAANTNLVSGTLVSSTWTLHALTAAATILKGNMFAVKIVYNSGTSIIVQRNTGLRGAALGVPYNVTNVSGSAVKTQPTGSVLLALGNSATTFYAVENCYPILAAITNSTFNNTSSAKRGLRFQVPFTCRCAGLAFYNSTQIGDFNAALLDDAGAELSSSNTAFDGDQSVNVNSGVTQALFDSAVTLSAGTWYRASVEPSSATNINLTFMQLPSSNYRSAWPGGLNHHYATFVTGVWTDTATDSIPLLDILIDQIDAGGGGGGIPRARGSF